MLPTLRTTAVPTIATLDVQPGFWMEPTGANLAALAVGDDTGAVISGSPTLITAAHTYSEGSINAIAFPATASDRIAYPNLSGHPFTTLAVDEDRGWWISCLYRLGEAASNEGMYGNGASGTTDPGIRCLLTGNSPTISIGDGVARHTEVMPSWLGNTIGEWYHHLHQYKVNSAGNIITVRHIINGVSTSVSSQAERDFTGLDLSSAITPSKNWCVGDSSASGGLPFKGDLLVAAGELPNNEFFDHDLVNAFCNYQRGRLYADMIAQPVANDLKYFIMGAPSTTEIPVTVRSDTGSTITVNALNASTRTQEATANATISNGLGKAKLTGLTADTDYLLEFVSGGTVQRREGRVKTAPASLDFNVAFASCCKFTEHGTAIETSAALKRIAHIEKPLFCVFNGDMGYHDPTTNTLAHFIERMDTIIDHNTAKLFFDHVPVVYTADDHDSLGNDLDSSSAYLTAARQYVRGINGLPTADFADANAWYHSIVIDDLRVIVLDTRSEKIDASQMVSATQLAWIESEIAAAAAASQIYVIVSPNCWDGPLSLQSWDHANFIAQRQAIFDKIHTEFGTVDHGFTASGDIHMRALDTGVNQGNHDAGGLLTVPCIHASRMMHSFGSTSGTWDTYSHTGDDGWGMSRFTDNGATVDTDLEIWQGSTLNSTLSVTLTKAVPPPLIAAARPLAPPSRHAGYARSRSEAADPALWHELKGAVVPYLGATGIDAAKGTCRLRNEVNQQWMTPATATSDTGYAWRGNVATVADNTDTQGLAGTADFRSPDDFKKTVAVWAKANINARSNNIAAMIAVAHGDLLIGIGTGTSELWRLNYRGGASDSTIDATDRFHFVVATSDGTTATMYVDGQATHTGSWTTHNPTNPELKIFGSSSSANFGFPGEIKAAYYWDRQLTLAEIQRLTADPLLPMRLR